MAQTKFVLDEKDLPSRWYNIQADLPAPLPPVIHPGTLQPIGPQDLAPLFPMEIIKQEVSQERWIDIPEPVRDVYRLWRPTPLYRAHRLEKALGTPARIYYKWEGVSPAGSHKPNTAVAQAYYNHQEGVRRITTETGRGAVGLGAVIRLPDLRDRVQGLHGAGLLRPEAVPADHDGGVGRQGRGEPVSRDRRPAARCLRRTRSRPGSLGIAISEAVEEAAQREDTKYSLGSVLNHVLTHQTVIGLEAQRQLEMAGDRPDILIGCIGGGSNFGGFTFPFLQDKLHGRRKDLRVIAVEPQATPSLTKGEYVYDFGDTGQMTPLIKMYTLGHSFIPAPIHAGGLRYHGMAPLVCALYDHKLIEAVAVHQNPTFEAALTFARAEGFLPAPEAAHAIRVVIDEALRCKASGDRKVIAFNFCGHGHFDLSAYERYMTGKLEDFEYPAAEVKAALAGLPKVKV